MASIALTAVLTTILIVSFLLNLHLLFKVDELQHHASQLSSLYDSIQKRTEDIESEYQLRLELWKKGAEKQIRTEALRQSRSTLRGQATEHVAPFQQQKWSPKDFRHLGEPIDYLICAGLTDVVDGAKNEVDEVVLLDVKTGNATLSKPQRKIRDAIIAGRVCFALYKSDSNELKVWHPGSKKEFQE